MKLYIKSLMLFALVFLGSNVNAQKWKSHYRLAEKKMKQGDRFSAGYHYEAAYRAKPKRKIAYKAAESYYGIKDFRRAANMYAKILGNEKHYPLIRLKYARCLKQSGNYEQAIREFVFFISHYKGNDKSTWNTIVDKEIEGCALGISYSANNSGLLKINHLSTAINSRSVELAPIPVTNDILYFTSLRNGTGTLLRADRENDVWSNAKVPENFPKIEGSHFGSGTLSSDYRRFYFTECENTKDLRARCRIFVTVKQSDSWSVPEVLADYLNWPGSTTTQPYVTSVGGKELLFFASDREEGFGGLDLYVAERDLRSDVFDFSFPQNLGAEVNTSGDEQTPFFVTEEEALYFSSDGHVSIGGQDIFKIQGRPGHFAEAINLGAPINSPADDLYFVKSSSGDNGYIVSNRIFGNEKISTTDEDIFSFNFSPNHYTLSGYLLDGNHKVVRNAEVSLYEVNGNGENIFLTGKTVNDGLYQFPVRVGKNYLVEVEKDGYPIKSVQVNTFGTMETEQMIRDIVITETSAYETLAAAASKPRSSVGTSVSLGYLPSLPKSINYKLTPSYKIQLSASAIDSDLQHKRYGRIKNLGKIEKNYIAARDIYWIILGDFGDYSDAIRTLAKVKNRGFGDAFVVKYRNGERIGVGK